jgi:aspartyl-tRNA(Asn)/glutamyl-tRNA(Gln) amidotransferase subunit C
MTKNKITEEKVKHVAQLAKLELTGDEVEKFTKQLANVLDYVEELESVDTKNTTETSQTTGLTDVYRDDKKRSSINKKAALDQAVKTHNGYFMVEGIFEDDL